VTQRPKLPRAGTWPEPELNPVELVWEYLRANKLSMIVWDSYDAILKACSDAWNCFIADPKSVASIAQTAWASVNNWEDWCYSRKEHASFLLFDTGARHASMPPG
jgi:hypothetical protein